MNTPLIERRAALQEALADAQPPIHITPATRDLAEAQRWFEEFEGAGLDGLIAKKLDLRYQPDKRVMSKIKHERTADCVVAGYRVHKSGPDAIGSVLLGLYDDRGVLASVGVIGAFPMATRKKLFDRAAALRHHLRRPPVELGGPRRGRTHPAEERDQPVERRQGPVLRPAATGTGGRGPLRLHGGRPVPAHRAVRSLAPGPRPGVLHVRAARPARSGSTLRTS